jgi:ATP-dependent DNA ligase
MKDKPFRPMKAPNEELAGKTAYDKVCMLNYPLIGSMKYDGFRCNFYEGQMRTASLKPFNNIHINEKFLPIINYIKTEYKNNLLFDGELLAPSTPFNIFSGIFRSDEMILPKDTKFFMFDSVFHNYFEESFEKRILNIEPIANLFPELIFPVEQRFLYCPEDVINFYEQTLNWTEIYEGEEHFVCDGLILRSPTSKYKLGRGTMKEGLIYKLKPFQTFDAKIIEIEEGTNVDPKADKKINEMGYSETSKKKNDRILGGWAKNFVVMHEGQRLSVAIKDTKEKKFYIWQHQDEFIGKMVEYKGLMIGAVDLPRHPTQVRMRPDKN